jgi:hypothetical protein
MLLSLLFAALVCLNVSLLMPISFMAFVAGDLAIIGGVVLPLGYFIYRRRRRAFSAAAPHNSGVPRPIDDDFARNA